MTDEFKTGRPARPDVEKLNAVIDLKIGDVVTHAQIAAIIGETKGSNRYRTVVAAWRAYHWRESKIQIEVEINVGYRALTAAQAATNGVERMGRIARANRKLGTRVIGIDTRNMEPEKKHLVSVATRFTDAVKDASRQANKDLAHPSPVTATTLQLAK